MTTYPESGGGISDDCDWGEGRGGVETEATNDRSPYWRSVPDPPAPAFDAAAATAGTAADNDDATGKSVMAAGGPARRCRDRERDHSFALRDVTNRRVVSNEGGGVDGRKKKIALGKKAVAASGSFGRFDSVVPKSLLSGEGDDVGGLDGDEILEMERDKRNQKRKKQRRISLLLPGYDSATGGIPSIFSASANVRNGVAASKDVVQARREPAVSGMKNNQNNILVQLVRDYISLPTEYRVDSKEANEINLLSGYPVPDKVLPVMDANSATREEFLSRVQPIVQEMERRKKKDEADTRLATRCEFKKNGKGRYCYCDVNSREPVPADEYKLRYAAMIDERRCRKRNGEGVRAEECPEQRGSQDRSNNNHFGNNEEKKIQEVGHDSNDDSNMDMDESVSMDDSNIDDSKMNNVSPSMAELGDGSPASKDSSTNNIGLELPVGTKSSQGDNAKGEPSSQQNNGIHNRSNSQPPNNLLAGMPASDDPHVMAARRKLWRAIDTALAEYSREILAIEGGETDDNGEKKVPIPIT